jgi:transcriptional antiterminator RfaH
VQVGSDRYGGAYGGETGTAGLKWYAVNTLPNSEQRARVNLERQGWHCFCPWVSKTTKSGRRMTTSLRALFPGYIFVTMNPAQSRWRSVDGTYGVRAIVKAGDLPAPLPAGVVETLIAMTDEAGKVSFASSLNPGQDVHFLSGPLAGLIGRLEHLDAAGRVTVLLDLLGRATPIKGHASELAPHNGD